MLQPENAPAPEELNTGFYLYETSQSVEMLGLDLADEIRERRLLLDLQAWEHVQALPRAERPMGWWLYLGTRTADHSFDADG